MLGFLLTEEGSTSREAHDVVVSDEDCPLREASSQKVPRLTVKVGAHGHFSRKGPAGATWWCPVGPRLLWVSNLNQDGDVLLC